MILSNQQKKHLEKAMANLAIICKGDFVKVVDCLEADYYTGQTFEVKSEPRQIGGTWCVSIDSLGYYDIARLEKCEG